MVYLREDRTSQEPSRQAAKLVEGCFKAFEEDSTRADGDNYVLALSRADAPEQGHRD